TGVVSQISHQNPTGQAPVVTRPPVDEVARLGCPATFAVVALGSAPLTYHCQRHGCAIPGANCPTSTIPSVAAAARRPPVRIAVQGQSQEALLAGLFGTRAYLARHGRTARGFLKGLYRDVLGRDPSRRERAATRALGTVAARQKVAHRLLASDEARARFVAGL